MFTKEKCNRFIGSWKHLESNFQENLNYSVLFKIIDILKVLDENKLKKIYKVIKLITGMEGEDELKLLMSDDVDNNRPNSERISNSIDDKSSIMIDLKNKEAKSNASFGPIEKGILNFLIF
jgi:hypothetical protein